MAVSAVSADIAKLNEVKRLMFEQFTNDSNLTIRSFLKAWCTCKFTELYENKPERELIDFISQLLQTTVESFAKCNSIERRVFSLYLAASVFLTQPIPFKMPIKITPILFDDLIEMISQVPHVKDVQAIAHGLSSKDAWCLIYSFQVYGPKIKTNGKASKVDNQLSQDRFNLLKSSLRELATQVSEGHEEYEKLKLDKGIDVLDPTPDRVGAFFNEIDTINTSKTQLKQEQSDDIGLKRRNLKNKPVQNQGKVRKLSDTKPK